MTAQGMRRITMIAPLLFVGCRTSLAVERLPPAQSPFGNTVRYTVDGGAERRGELLLADSIGVWLLQGDRVLAGPWNMFTRMETRAPDRPRVRDGERPDAVTLRAFQRVARFPFGLDASQRAAFLTTHGQDEPVPIAGGGPAPGLSAALLDSIRTATGRFATRETAIAAGYRRLGPDFPTMGEHWIHPGQIMTGRIDPTAPPVLSYAEIDGEPRLVGVAWALPLHPDSVPPALPFGRHAWHDHSGTVTEETLLIDHPSTSHERSSGYRIAMVHVWASVPNPDGILAQHNWALPFLRAGLSPPGESHPAAARGLSLAGDGWVYYRTLLHRAGVGDVDGLNGLLQDAAADVDAWLARSDGPPDLAVPAQVWADLLRRLHRVVPADARGHLAVLGEG